MSNQSTDLRNARYDPMSRDEVIEACEAERLKRQQAEHERDGLVEELARWSSRCTGLHGSQVSCGALDVPARQPRVYTHGLKLTAADIAEIAGTADMPQEPSGSSVTLACKCGARTTSPASNGRASLAGFAGWYFSIETGWCCSKCAPTDTRG